MLGVDVAAGVLRGAPEDVVRGGTRSAGGALTLRASVRVAGNETELWTEEATPDADADVPRVTPPEGATGKPIKEVALT